MADPGTFRCEHCGGVFDKGRSDEEARAEAQALFPGLRQEDAAVVCDDCHREFMAWVAEQDEPVSPAAPASDGPVLWWMVFLGDAPVEGDLDLGAAIIEAPTIEKAAAVVAGDDTGRFPRGMVHAGRLAPWARPEPGEIGRWLSRDEARALANRLAARRMH